MPWDSRDEAKKAARVSAMNAEMTKRHREWDLAAKDNTMNYMRPSFSVGALTTEQYRNNYDAIDWTDDGKTPVAATPATGDTAPEKDKS